MKTVLVTGASGFIGKNLCAQLEHEKDIEILRFTKDNTDDELRKFIAKADFVFHFAGVNRPKDESEFDDGNRSLTADILDALQASGSKASFLLTSSTQASLDNPYGKSKKAAEDAVFGWAKTTGLTAYVYRLPNVFGKWCKPNYNSVVATFCYNIANGLGVTINDPETTLPLVYIDDVIGEFIKALKGEAPVPVDSFYRIPRNFKVTLRDLVAKLQIFKDIRKSLLVPDFENVFDKFLYATYTSYFDEKEFDYDLEMKQDERGWLAEFIKSKQTGQLFVSRTKPGFSRGNHWHHTKIEKFLVIEGEAEISLRNLNSEDVIAYKVNGDKLQVVDIPAGYVHSIKNIGKADLLTLIWADEIFDPQQPDTYYLEV